MLWKLLCSAFQPRASANTLVNRGLALREAGRLAEAERVLHQAVEQFPRDAVAATNLAIVLLEQDKGEQGVGFLQRALDCDPRCAAAHYNLANVLRASRRLNEAIEHYRAASQLDAPPAAAREELMHTLLEVCDWDGADAEAERLRALVAERPAAEWMPCVSPWTPTYLGLDPALRKQVAAYHAGVYARGMQLVRRRDLRGEREDGRIRIAYLSRDFRDHPVGQLIRSAFGLHDRKRFEVFAFSHGPDDGSVSRASIAAGADHFRDVARKSDAEVAEEIAAAGIHVLIDLAGHTTGNRLGVLARRPAAVQAHYLGYPGTTGAPYVDYFITDHIATPPRLAAEFTEELAYLPRCFMVSDDSVIREPGAATRTAEGLPDEAFVFCNFGNSSRITREVFASWLEILRAVPSSVLWLGQSSELTIKNLRDQVRRGDIDPGRVVFAQRVPDKRAHLARLGLADLALDTFGWYNGHSSTSDMLWAGVAVLTTAGETFASRVAASLLHAAGLSELATRDARDYVQTAVRLGNDRAQTSALKRKLDANRNSMPFFDPRRIVADLEAVYLEMWRRCKAGEAPTAINPIPGKSGER